MAVGDGFPYANEFDKMGYDVFGIDLSPTHVEMVKKALLNVNVDGGDSEDLQFSNNIFDGGKSAKPTVAPLFLQLVFELRL